jgi:diguanylate cyclase (GGDEF)-like protein
MELFHRAVAARPWAFGAGSFTAVEPTVLVAVMGTTAADLVDHWRTQLRVGDTIARFGGDEFVVVLPSCDLAGATSIVERLRVSGSVGTTCSVGLAELRPGDTASLLVSRADTALYDAKRLGRDQLACAT